MKKLIWLVDMSLDGFMSGPGGELDWMAANIDDELWEDVNDLLRTVDTALFGRVTYQNFESYWPAAASNPASPKHELDFSHWIDVTPKIVASKTLNKLEWKNSILLTGDVVEGVSRIKGQTGKDLLMFGSCNLASHLLKAGLIDKLQMRVHPIILGEGRPLFKDGTGRHNLQLVKSRTFPSGVVQLRYNVA